MNWPAEEAKPLQHTTGTETKAVIWDGGVRVGSDVVDGGLGSGSADTEPSFVR